MLWVDAYRPLRLTEVAGNHAAKARLVRSLVHPTAPIVVSGAVGSGKRTAALCAIEDRGWRAVQHCMTDTTIASLERACHANALGDAKSVLVVYDLAYMSRNDHKQLIDLLRRLVAAGATCIAIDDIEVDRCDNICFEPVPRVEICEHLAWVAAMERVEFSESYVAGDIRSSVHAMQLGVAALPYSAEADEHADAMQCREEWLGASLDDVIRLSEAVCDHDVRELGPTRAALEVAARGMRRSRANTASARHAQNVGARLRLRGAMVHWSVEPLDGSLASELIRAAVMSGETPPSFEAGACLTTLCKAATSNEKRKLRYVVRGHK